jgi:Mg-chelatase subunit ChlD
MRIPLLDRRPLFPFLPAAALAAVAVVTTFGAACAGRANDALRTSVSSRLEPRYDPRVVDEFKDLSSVTGGEAWSLPAPDATGLGAVVDAAAGAFSAVDVAFVIDTTHSMKDSLAALAKDADTVMARLWAKSTGARVAVVAYRDTGDVYTSRIVSDFSDKRDHAVAALRGLHADGGGDLAEHVYSGLMLAATKLTWRPEARKAIVLLGDAPAHEGYADGDTREKFVGHARSVSLSVYAVALPSYLTDVAPGGADASHGDVAHAGGTGAGMKAVGGAAGDLATALDYDMAAMKDLSGLAAAGGGMLHLSPCPEELRAVLRGALHSVSARSAGKPLDLVILLDTSSSMMTSAKAARMAADSAMMDLSDKHADARVGLVLYVAGAGGAPGTGKVEQDLTETYDKVRDAFWRVTPSGTESGRDFTAALKASLEGVAWRGDAAKYVVLVTDGQSARTADRDKVVSAARGRGVTVDAVLVGFNPYDGPFDDAGGVGAIDSDDMDKTGDVDDLPTIVKIFPKGRVEESTSVKDFERHLKDLFEEIRKSGSPTSIEVALVVDATGSMGSTLDGISRSHEALHEFLEGGGRVAVVSFKDIDDDYVARKDTDFVSDPHVILNALSKISAEGGGDLPEAHYYGLEEATRLSWTPGSKRFVVLVTDDVAHRDADKKDAVAAWAKSGDATLFAIDCHFGYGDGDDSGYDPPEPGYTPDAVAKMFGKDAGYVKVADKKGIESALDKMLAELAAGKKPEKIDLALVVDTTGSMGDALEALGSDKGRFEKFLDKKGLHRVAVVNYRDEGDDWVARVDRDFTTKVDDLLKALGKLSAGGGGDLPEALFTGIKTATTDLKWDPKAKKVIVVVTDAEAHESKKDREAVVEWATKNKAIIRVIHMSYDDAGD